MARWVFTQKNNDLLRGPRRVPPAILSILQERGVTEPSCVEDFLAPFPKLTHDPFLLNDMAQAAQTVVQTALGGGRICVYGDYDADGVTSAALLLCTLRAISDRVRYYIPSRFHEGYGLSTQAIDTIASEGIDLIITVDCGSTSVSEAAHAKSLGIELIITDHHSPAPDATPDCLFINPKRSDSTYPFPHLSGCGVAFKLAQAIQRLLEQQGDGRFLKADLNRLLDLVAISTVADVVPLLDENRTLVKYGLEFINRREREGLDALLEAVDFGEREVEAGHIAYMIAPNINAQGRMESADPGVDLLCGDADGRSGLDRIARDMAANNRARKAEQEKTHRLCEKIIGQGGSGELFPVVYAPDAHEGVAGIVAGHLKESLYRPVFIVTDGEEGLVKGTGRSVPGLDLHGMLSSVAPLFERFGGHAGACGFTMKKQNLERFRQAMQEAMAEALRADPDILTEEIKVVKVLDASEKTLEFAETLRLLEPHGEANPKPLFASGPSRVESVHRMGTEEEHARFMLRTGDGTMLPCILFRRAAEYGMYLQPGAVVDVAGELGINEFRDTRSLQLVARDIRRGDGA
ncbi:MAG TPA: single-stranded-DNA-specific exonuclease RecJ [Clostridiales bacterium]|jgi:single-stranded-DNA-specific exonuclease|nr:single-stranded-DNA-specific exonuclease RecJ [Clostridiales bacterium]